MALYVARRLVALAVLAFAVSVLVFLILRLIPGDPVMAMLGTNAADANVVARLRNELGLNETLPQQYALWIGGVVHGNLGYSFAQSLPVSTLIQENFPYTLQLTLCGLGLSIVLGVVLGTLAAVKRNTAFDTVATVLALIGLSVPGFWMGLLLITLFSVTLHWFAVFEGASPKGLILPSIALGIEGAGYIARFVRTNMLDVLRQQYVVTARSKGLSRFRVLGKHVFRNALIPIIALIGLQFGNLLSGTVVIETVFSRPGIGRLLVDSIIAKDYLTVQGIVLLIAILYALVNLMVDLLYPLIDPRIAY